MRYFKLLEGAHQETTPDGNKDYQAKEVRDKQGNITELEQPIVPSEKDLVKLFGSEKFVEVSESQVPRTLLRAAEDKKESEQTSPKDESSDSAAYEPSPSDEEEIQEAAEKGAKDIGPDLGKDVTHKFSSAKKAELKVFMKPGGRYSVFDPDEDKIVTAGGPISKDKVEQCVEDYLET